MTDTGEHGAGLARWYGRVLGSDQCVVRRQALCDLAIEDYVTMAQDTHAAAHLANRVG